MAHEIDEALLMFLALIGLYSPIAAVSSYIPLLKPYTASQLASALSTLAA